MTMMVMMVMMMNSFGSDKLCVRIPSFDVMVCAGSSAAAVAAAAAIANIDESCARLNIKFNIAYTLQSLYIPVKIRWINKNVDYFIIFIIY